MEFLCMTPTKRAIIIDNGDVLSALAGNSIETPRILLNSASSKNPDGLANSSGQVGKNYMRHMSGNVWGVFERPVRMHRGNTMAGCIKDERYHNSNREFVGGYFMQTEHLGPSFHHFASPRVRSHWA